MPARRLSKLQAWILCELGRQEGGRLLRDDLRERLARSYPRAKERGKGLWATEALRATFRGNLSRSIGNLLKKGWISRRDPGPGIQLTALGRRILSERLDPGGFPGYPGRRRTTYKKKRRRRRGA